MKRILRLLIIVVTVLVYMKVHQIPADAIEIEGVTVDEIIVREVVRLNKPMSRGSADRPKIIDIGEFEITAYDLSYRSCQKYKTHPEYGITKDGTSLVGQSWDEALTIAVDNEIIPLGSKVILEFEEEEYKKFNNTYVARDIGGDIKNRRIDLFMGDFNSTKPSKEALEFGRVKNVRVKLIIDNN